MSRKKNGYSFKAKANEKIVLDVKAIMDYMKIDPRKQIDMLEQLDTSKEKEKNNA